MLENWLSPIRIAEKELIEKLSKEQFGRNIAIHLHDLTNLKKIDLAIIGISEIDANEVRKTLYSLDYPFHTLRIADLGNIRNEDSSFVIPVLKELLQSEIVPIIIGKTPNSSFAQFQAYNELKKSTNLVCIDEKVKYSHSVKSDQINYLNSILNAEYSNLFNLGVIGYQSHFTSDPISKMMSDNNFDMVRLGKIKSNIDEVEPLIRDADMVCFNLSVLKQSDAPAVSTPSPSGLFSEEAALLSRYAGISDKLTSIGFYGFDSELDHRNQTAQVLSQLIWYFIDGFHNRLGDFPISMSGLVEYIVEIEHIDKPMTFWKSAKTGRWWMQIPVKTKKEHERHRLVPCSYNDYQMSCNDQIPDRLLNAYKRFS